jgi:FG-GAP-like repeat/ASPIC and UnbV
MRTWSKAFLAGLTCAAAFAAAMFWLSKSSLLRKNLSPPAGTSAAGVGRRAPARPANVAIDPRQFEDSGFKTASAFTGTIRDPRSLKDLRDALEARGPGGIRELTARYQALNADPSKPEQAGERMMLEKSLGLMTMYEGRWSDSAHWIQSALTRTQSAIAPPQERAELTAIMGILALRRGEVENCINCVGPSSCIFPISRQAVHQNQEGSREAVRWFTEYLRQWPADLRIIWLLNIAYMTLGEYPEKVPPQFLISVDLFRSKLDVGRFENVASSVGLTSRGPNLCGGSVFDDFTGDSLPDIFTSSLDPGLGASLYVNRGDGSFEDRSARAGLADQVYALNVSRADFDNDGDLDVVLLRGGWERPLRLSLLQNRGDGSFADATIASGLGEPIQTEAAAWGDYDNDGWADLFVCGEYLSPGARAPDPKADRRNRCRLYRNLGDGRFVDEAENAGVVNERCAKGAAWGDYDGDGRLDLFVSNMGQESRLYRNEGGGRFKDVARETGITGPSMSFACWFWDYDNDGFLDLYVNDYQAGMAEVVASAAGVNREGGHRPRLYRNLGPSGFRDVCATAGLARAMVPMGCNFGDIDNDGFLDIYLGTGGMCYEYLVPNLMFKNVDGQRFEDVTVSSQTGHLQKGHGVSFADWDNDGDLDLFCEAGGAVPGDKSYNLLFQNPGHGHHWLKVRLIGTSTNRAALGAKVKVSLRSADGKTRSVHRTIGNNSSFGGNSLVESIGLLDATRVAELAVTWPTSGTRQSFRNLAADQLVVITEGSDVVKLARPAALDPASLGVNLRSRRSDRTAGFAVRGPAGG